MRLLAVNTQRRKYLFTQRTTISEDKWCLLMKGVLATEAAKSYLVTSLFSTATEHKCHYLFLDALLLSGEILNFYKGQQ